MDLDAIKVLLDSQAKAFHTAMDFVAEQFKSRIQEAEATIQDLSRSLEFTQAEVKDLQNEVKELRKLQSESVAPNDVLRSQDSSRNEGVSTHEAKRDVTEVVDRTGASDGKQQPDDSIRGAVGESPAEPLWARNARTRSRRKQ
ncbi:hypothetical protein Pmani_011876 [Petrolisthes manimaculis]|uniref:Uncharacterized protein n=1 Tax=Petrolisthes manimaculis TaxID=1843537 RepID=A0AAE1UF82_9EUCA|nr:hypothetical protein Pmani_011876 [Petrolisthes manimaculis]